MCEYCGCQALAAIAELTREHDEVVALISLVRDADSVGDVGAMAELARRIAVVLEPHTQVEEQGLFPPLAGEFAEHITVLEDEHRTIARVLGEAAGGLPADPAWPGRLMETMNLLRDHILAEQDGAFPAALAQLDPSDWEQIDKIRERAGVAVPDPAT